MLLMKIDLYVILLIIIAKLAVPTPPHHPFPSEGERFGARLGRSGSEMTAILVLQASSSTWRATVRCYMTSHLFELLGEPKYKYVERLIH